MICWKCKQEMGTYIVHDCNNPYPEMKRLKENIETIFIGSASDKEALAWQLNKIIEQSRNPMEGIKSKLEKIANSSPWDSIVLGALIAITIVTSAVVVRGMVQ